jgi:hypothetical protein
MVSANAVRRICTRSFAVPGGKTKGRALLKELTTDVCPFVDLPEKGRRLYSLTRDEMQNCQWLKALLVAPIDFQEWTPVGHLRNSSFAELTRDKELRQVMRE